LFSINSCILDFDQQEIYVRAAIFVFLKA